MTTDKRRARDFDEFTRAEGYVFSQPTLAKFMRAIRESDEAAGMVLVNRDMIQQAHALLAQIMSAGHNTPGPTPENIQDTFWRLDNMLAAATESDNG